MEEASKLTNLSSKDWFSDSVDYDSIVSFPLDASEGGFFTGSFVPPPPRPIFLDGGIVPDGLTTCDLCSWAWRDENSVLDSRLEVSGELGWVLTLIIVSLLSAIIGAIIMITVLHCKRLKTAAPTDPQQPPIDVHLRANRPPINTPDDKSPPTYAVQSSINGVWSWLSKRSATPSQLENPPPMEENHYTHMEDTLYAELDEDRDSTAYHNSGYADPDAPSAPSSAYYSDLSVTTVTERAYEVVGMVPLWEGEKRGVPKLAAINENTSVPSDYV